MNEEDEYRCVGICQADADGLCRGCGRPMWEAPASASARRLGEHDTPEGVRNDEDQASVGAVRLN